MPASRQHSLRLIHGGGNQVTRKPPPTPESPGLHVVGSGRETPLRRKIQSTLGALSLLGRRRYAANSPNPSSPELVTPVDKALIAQARGEVLRTFARRRSEAIPNFEDHTLGLSYLVPARPPRRFPARVDITVEVENKTENLKTMGISRVNDDGSTALSCQINFDGDNQPVVMVPGENGVLAASLNPASELSGAIDLARQGAPLDRFRT